MTKPKDTQDVRFTGDWEEGMRLFFEGVIQTSESATNTVRRLEP